MGGVPSNTIFRTQVVDADGNPVVTSTSASSAPTARPNVAVASTAGGTPIVGTSATPRIVSLFNHGASDIELFYGTAAGTAGNGFAPVPAKGYWESPVPITAAIAGLSASGTNQVTPVEYL